MNRRDARDLWYMIGAAAAVYGGIRYLLPLAAPFLFSYFLARLFWPVGRFFKKNMRLSGKWSINLSIGLLTVVIAGGVFLLVSILFGQIQDLLIRYPVYEKMFWRQLDEMCRRCDGLLGFADGTAVQYVSTGLTEAVTHISGQAVAGVGKMMSLGWVLFLVVWGAVLILKDMEDLKIIYEESFLYRHIGKIVKELGGIGTAYLRAQLIILCISTGVCTVGFWIIGNQYALLAGLVVSIFDAFPVVGSGLILIPWAVIELLKGSWFHASVLVTLYTICQVVREWTEAKIIGGRIGIKPIFTVMAMYAGVQLFGLWGFILGPAAFMLIKIIVQSQY